MVLNNFEERIGKVTGDGLFSAEIETLQVNVGLKCNQRCRHCHLECSPERTEVMEWSVMEQVLDAVDSVRCHLIDITGGAPELNPNFVRFVKALSERNHTIQVRTNLTVYLEPGFENMPEFLRKHNVQIVGSMPCYLEENVRAQRGEGVYEKNIEVIKKLNDLGYGTESGPSLDLVYNPGGPFLPPEQSSLEADYKHELGKDFGITFSHLRTIANMPIGRFLRKLCEQNQEGEYMDLLHNSFNAQTVDGLMCRHLLSVGWNGVLYDCDFNLALGLPINHGAPDHISKFNLFGLEHRRITTGEHCFGCTAGCGSSCGGALV